MFPTGSYTPANGAMPKPYQQMPQVFDKVFEDTSTHFHTHSATASTPGWIKSTANKMMLFLLQQCAPNFKLNLEHSSVSYTTDDITNYYDRHTTDGLWHLPNRLEHRLDIRPGEKTLRFLHVKRGYQIFEYLDGFMQDTKGASIFLQANRNHRVRVYAAHTPDVIYIVTSEYTWEFNRKVIAMLPLLYNIELPDNIKEIFRLYGEEYYEAWAATYQVWFDSLDLVNAQLKEDLKRLLASTKEKTLQNCRDKIDNAKYNISDHLNRLAALYKELNVQNIQLLGLSQIPEPDIMPLFEYFSKNKTITQFSTRANPARLVINLEAPLKYFDADALGMYYKHSNTHITSRPFMAWLFKQIFLEQKYDLLTEAIVYLDLENNTINYGSSTELAKTRLPHPHIMGANCFGSNKPHIIKALGNQDVIGAVEQTIGAAHNMNFTDGIIVEKLVDLLQHYNARKTILDLETNELYSVAELEDKYDKEVTAQ